MVVRDRDWRPPEPEGAAAATAMTERKRVLDDIAELGWPVFVKPARGGSSIGTSRVPGPAGLEEAIEAAREHDPKVIVEAAVPGREIECGSSRARDGGPPDASVPAEVLVGGGARLLRLRGRSTWTRTRHGHPAADLPAAAIEEVRRLAVQAFEALAARASPGWTSSTRPTAGSSSTRSTRCPG